MSISSFIAALFIARVVSADDLQDCLYALIAHPVHFDRLCAMHAMVTHANLRLCKAKYWLRTRAFRDRLVAVNLQNRAFTWAQDGPSSFFVVVCHFSPSIADAILFLSLFMLPFLLGYYCYSRPVALHGGYE
jgi:multisubunit Na+/H+ antiporter MnhF subunit